MLCWFVWTDNRVGDDGMEVLCEALMENTALTKLNMERLLWMALLRIAQTDEMDEWEWTGNGIGDGGAVALSHVLESEETVLASISLYGVLPLSLLKPLIWWMCLHEPCFCDVCGCGNRKQDRCSWCECVV